MVKLEFSQTKDENQTFCAEGLFYHSKYSPQKEADRFVEGLTLPFNPKIIFILEPGLDYCSSLISKKFNNCKTAAIRLFETNQLPQGNWDYNIPYTNKTDFKQMLINTFGENMLLSSGIFIWPACKNVFPEIYVEVLESFKNAVEECKTLLVTRQFFEKKWLINSLNYINFLKKPVVAEIKKDMPVVICASGPSLFPCLDLIKENRNKIFVICLSSATSVLIHNSIIPDLILTTDGGFWAGQHLKVLKKFPDIPVAAPIEAFLPKYILNSNPIIPLMYDDSSSFISNTIIEQTGIKYLKATRNPTVSGTALFFANELAAKKIYFCGLDLSASIGLSHTKPNALEINNELNDNRMHTKAHRISASNLNTGSLKIYKEWFCSLENPNNKTCRIIDDFYKNNSLGNIKDISSQDFAKELSSYNESSQMISYKPAPQITNKEKVFDYIINELKSDKWKKQIFPADFISMENTGFDAGSINRLQTKIDKLVYKIRSLKGE